ncbi:MAG: L,D-transpeptidase [Okeania sp. SIO2C2]|nr:L,D-transpeptidase [Okeania sp. SIO2C2]NEP90657.1 L,D-transpeptidase [Okeania sp. SIO2C2]
MNEKVRKKSLSRWSNSSQKHNIFSGFHLLILLSISIVISWNYLQRKANASTPVENQEASTNATDLIEIQSPIKSKSPITKKILKELYIQQNENIYLVIKLSDRRVYIYQDEQLKTSYPIAIGREGWETPSGTYKVMQKIPNPSWKHPFTGEIIPPGPENPLGERWIGFWTDGTNYIGFHGTPDEETVGQAASHGCVRMLNQDVLALFEKVAIGTTVIVEP